ncbi:MAG TPA: PAS domain S-box protein [Chlorobaculum sp.]|nr:PAS domain S-box protein [Chlorobaculum sp.]
MSFEYSDFGLFKDFPEPVFVMDPEGTILDSNEVFASRFLSSIQEIRGLNVYELMSTVQHQPEVAAGRRIKADEVLRTGKHLFFEDEKDRKKWRNSIYPIRSSEGDINRLLIFVHDITERKKVELESHKHNLFYKALLDAIPGSVLILDSRGGVIGYNRCTLDIFGKSEHAMHGCDAFEIIHPDDRPQIREKFLNILNSGVEDAAEARVCIRGKQKYVRWCIIHARKTLIDKQPYIITVGIDIDNRKRAEEALIENKRWLGLAMENARIGIWDWNAKTNENVWSNELWALAGLDKDSTSCSFGLWTNLIHPDDRDAVIRLSDVNLKDKAEPKSIEYRICRPDGTTPWMLSYGKPIRDQHGKLLRLVGTTMDITERKTIEEELKRSRERLDFALEKCHLGWWDLDLSTNQANRTLEHDRIFGYEALLPQWTLYTFLEHIVPDDLAMVTQLFQKTQATHSDINFECRITRHDGQTRWIWAAGGFRHDKKNGAQYMSGFVQDITDRKREEEEREQLQIQFQQAQKMEVVGQLAGGIAHDFNNALSAILGNAELLLGKIDHSLPYIEYVRNIQESASRSANLTRQLLGFARKQFITPKVFFLNKEIETLLPMLRRLLGSHIHFLWRPKDDQACIHLDPSQLDQILINLCINARDAIVDSGTITIETCKVHVEPSESAAGHPCQTPGKYVRISVSDTGCGVDTKALPHIFEPFFTTKEAGKGTGLGLSTIYGILKQNKGFIDCLTSPGEGTTFNVYLPVQDEPLFKGKDENIEYTVETACETILLVEDEPSILNILTGLLEDKGFKILAARNADTAVRMADQHPGEIDLLVTDIMLPDINGVWLSEKLESRRPGLKTLFMSGYTQETIARYKQFEEGVNFIQKPFSINSFMNIVSRMIKIELNR